MRNLLRGSAALGVAIVTAVTLSSALPADASSTPGWRIVYHHHYTPGNSEYFAVTATGLHDAWAVGGADFAGPIGGRPVAVHWLNGHWVATVTPAHLTSTLQAVSADSVTDAWAVSNLGGYVLHWHNGRWTVAHRWPETGLPAELTGVTAFSPTNVWVFGGSGAFPGLGTWHFNGDVWTRVTGFGGNISFASALSPTNMWAVGGVSAGEDAIMHYVAGKWHHLTSPVLSGFQFSGILAASAGNVWATASKAGSPGTGRLLHLSKGRWTSLSVPGRDDPTQIAADGSGGLWLIAIATDGEITLLHRHASGRWTVAPSPGAMGLANIPGTTSMWGSGSTGGSAGFEAAIYAFGRIG